MLLKNKEMQEGNCTFAIPKPGGHCKTGEGSRGAFPRCGTGSLPRRVEKSQDGETNPYAKKEGKKCDYCHVKTGSKDLNDTGKCYEEKKHSLEGCPTPEQK